MWDTRLISAAANLFISAAGAGLLSYPFACMHQGIIVCMVLTLGFAVLTIYADFILVQSAHLFRHQLQQRTFEEISLKAFGPRMYGLSAASVLIGCLGAMIGFMIVVGDMAVPIAEHLCSGSSSAACGVLSSRAFLVLMCAVFVALPLSSFKRIHSLVISSVLAAVTVLAVGALVVARGVSDTHGNVATTTTTAPPDPAAPDGPIVLARFNFVGWMLGMPISIFSLGNHCQVVPVFMELPPPQRAKFHRAVYTAVAGCCVLYLLTGIFGYLAFRDGTKGDVLLNFAVSDPVADVAKALLAVHIVLAYPVLLFPCREAIALLLALWRSGGISGSSGGDATRSVVVEDEDVAASERLLPRGGAAAAAAAEGEGDSGVGGSRAPLSHSHSHSHSSRWARLAASPLFQSTILVLLTSGTSVLFPQVAVVFGLVGATCAVWQIYGVPGLLLLRWSAARAGHYTNVAAAKAPLSGPDAVWATVASDGSGHYGDSSDGSDGSDSAEEAAAAQPLQYLPLSPLTLKLHGYGLLFLFVSIGCIGTGTYIYSTWFDG